MELNEPERLSIAWGIREGARDPWDEEMAVLRRRTFRFRLCRGPRVWAVGMGLGVESSGGSGGLPWVFGSSLR